MMKHLLVICCLVPLITNCGKNDEIEIYNENNTNVVNGIVYDIEEYPINGIYKTYHSNGEIRMEIEARGGVPDGEGRFYDENGNLQYSGTFKGGKINGKFYQYYEDGNIHNELNYIDGMQDGIQILYDNKGQVAAEIVYEGNKAISGCVVIDGEKIQLDNDELNGLIPNPEIIEEELASIQEESSDNNIEN